MLLTDLGADVVKVEPSAATQPEPGGRTCPRAPDRVRARGLLREHQPQQRGICLDLTTASSRDDLLALRATTG